MTNGKAGKEIVYRRGLRQEDPLSPLIFILVASDPNRTFEKAKRAQLLEGLPGCSSISLTNLQYANDTLIFGNGDVG